MIKLFKGFKTMSYVIAGLLALTLSVQAFSASPTLDRVLKNNVLKVAMSGDQPPFNVMSRNKKMIGYDVDLANYFASTMQVKLEIVQMPFGEIADAVKNGAKVKTGGERQGNKGYFYEPTVLTDVPLSARIMNEEPFGPLAPITPFSNFDDVVKEANRLPYGLAAYAYTKSAKTAEAIGSALSSGMVSINHHGLAMPETPFGGIGDSGFGKEGGMEGIESYFNTKFITQAGL